MRIVVDSNAFQSDELNAYLAASVDNAVLTDYAATEAHKGDILRRTSESAWQSEDSHNMAYGDLVKSG